MQCMIKILATALTVTVLTGCSGMMGAYDKDDNLITPRAVKVAVSNPRTVFDVIRPDKGKQGENAPRPFMGISLAPNQMIADAGTQVLLRDGNAVDAAIAMGFMQAVIRPQVAGLGSQGVCLVNNSQIGLSEVLDFTLKNSNIPTMVRGLAVLHSRYGNEKWSDLVLLAEQQARRGITLSPDQISMAEKSLKGGAVIEGQPLKTNKVLYRDRLSLTLSLLRLQGGGALYTGKGLDLLLADAQRLGISLDKDTVANYQPTWLPSLRVRAGDYAVYTVGHPLPLGTPVAQGVSLSQGAFAKSGIFSRDLDTPRYNAVLKNAVTRVNNTILKTGVSIADTAIMAVDDEGLAVICQSSLNGDFGVGSVSQNLGMTLPKKVSQSLYLPIIGVNKEGHFRFMASPIGDSVTLYDALNTVLRLATLTEDNSFTDVVNPSRTWTDGKTWFTETTNGTGKGTATVRTSGVQVNGAFCPSALPANPISCSAGTDPRGDARIRFAGFDSSIVSER